MATPPLLTATPSGDVLELRPGGSWTAAYVTTLEALTGAVTARLDHSKAVKVDMAEVRELDTLGAWLLEKMSRNIGRASRRNRRRGRQLCRPHRGGPSGQSSQSGSGPSAKSCRRQGGRNRPRRCQFDGRQKISTGGHSLPPSMSWKNFSSWPVN